MKTTLYRILGVDPAASADEIKAAYERSRQLADANGADPGAVALLKQALEVLSDPLRRNAYDAALAAAASGDAARGSRRGADSARAMTPLTWLVVVAAVVTAIAAAVWVVSQRETPRPPVSPSVRPSTAASAPSEQPDVVPVRPALTAVQGTGSAERMPETSVPAIVRPMDTPAPASTIRSAENVFSEAAPSIARVNVMDDTDRTVGTGSGVVIDNGIVVTSCHVAKLGTKLAVKFGELVLPATIRLADEEYDLCRLAVSGLRAPPVKIGSVASLRTGQKVYAIGAPAGLELTISEGIVSSLRRIDEGTVIQTTAPISPGSSGGGLFDLSGQLVGIMTFQHRFGQNLNFALPADWIAKMKERGLGSSGWRSAAIGASAADRPGGLIVGQWLCRDWITGRAGRFKFEPDGRVNIAMSDIPAVMLNYGTSGKSLVVFDANKGVALTINELTARKMLLKGTDRSIACER
jgi:S1-C subfamily serine protease